MKSTRSVGGFSVIEIVVVLAILGILLSVIGGFLKITLKDIFKSGRKTEAEDSLRHVLDILTRDFGDITDVLQADPQTIVFACNSHRVPGGAYNYLKTDQDNDAMNIATSPFNARFTGYDLDDESDNGDTRVDFRSSLKLIGDKLVQKDILNQPDPAIAGDWDSLTFSNQRVIAVNVSTFALTYYGGLAYLSPPHDDNADGVVTAVEIDSGTVGGNNSGTLDLQSERDKLSILRVTLGIRHSKTSVDISTATTEIVLPLVPLKRRIP